MSIPITQFVPPHPVAPLVTTSLFSTSVTQLLFCKHVHLYPFLKFHRVFRLGLEIWDRFSNTVIQRGCHLWLWLMVGRPGLGEQCLTDDCFLTHPLISQIYLFNRPVMYQSLQQTHIEPILCTKYIVKTWFPAFSLGRILPPNLFCTKPSLRLKVKYAL